MVVIKDMEFPSCCGECDLLSSGALRTNDVPIPFCPYTCEEIEDIHNKPSGCPLYEIQ